MLKLLLPFLPLLASHTQTSAFFATLPPYTDAPYCNLALGTMIEEECAAAINSAYDEAVHNRSNTLIVCKGSTGKCFVCQLSKYLWVFSDAGPYEGQAIKAAIVFQQLQLHKPFQFS